MASYDFLRLNDKEFECLVNDLVSEIEGVHVERFKAGRDQGIDGRYFKPNGKNCIIQSKHYLGTGFNGLLNKIRRDESKKLSNLNPDKYILATSVGLSPSNKSKLEAAFLGRPDLEIIIYGQEDIESFLDKYPWILEKHYKLWIASTAVLKNILHADVVGRSRYKIEQILEESSKFVETESFLEALKKLNDSRTIVVSGEPGAGKTTIAKNLCLYLLGNEYEFFEIVENLSEAERVYEQGKKQVFYFDDFLGSNYLEAIEGRSDSHIVDFIQRVSKASDKYFILTSRTNILNAGVVISSIYASNDIRRDEYLIDVNKLPVIDKAKILYSHVWGGDLPADYVERLYQDKRYRIIVKHKNFNPRLVEMVTTYSKLGEISTDDYWPYIEGILNNPEVVWEHCFNIQSDDFCRLLVVLVVIGAGSVEEGVLRSSYNKAVESLGVTNSNNRGVSFDVVSRLAVRSLLKRQINQDLVFYSPFNPSLTDYVLSSICKDFTKYIKLFSLFNDVSSLKFLRDIYERGMIGELEFCDALKKVIISIDEKDLNYRFYAIFLVVNNDLFDVSKELEFSLHDLEFNDNRISDISEFLSMFDLICTGSLLLDVKCLISAIGDAWLDEDKISLLESVRRKHFPDSSELLELLVEKTEEFARDELDYIVDDVDLDEFIVDEDGEIVSYDGGISEEITGLLTNKLKCMGIDPAHIDVRGIVMDVDISGMVDTHIHKLENQFNYQGAAMLVESDEIDECIDECIDEIFDRG